MDLENVIRELYAQKATLEQAISLLEGLQHKAAPPSAASDDTKRRGRKSMDLKERQDVSARMKKYWAARRKEQEKV
ncbi:MAG: hypothetical protein LAP87_04610 [Acidobacteriia bacterium]|nr:hypothetical protein [Terriglobia bacterium]